MNITELNQLVQDAIFSLDTNLPYFLQILALMWAVHIVNVLLGHRLNALGIYPRHPLFLPGIIFSPILHGNFSHLAINSILFIALASLLSLSGLNTFNIVSFNVIILSGALTWLFGRPAIHIGASSLIMGYWGFILMNAYASSSFASVVLAALCVYFLWWMILSLVPTDRATSWEGHIFGFIAGLLTSYYYLDAQVFYQYFLAFLY